MLLNLGTQLIAAKRPDDLDERQRSLWQRAHQRAYRILVVFAALLMLYVLVLGELLWMPSTSREWTVTVTAFWIFLVMLPSSLIYWTEPDLLDDA